MTKTGTILVVMFVFGMLMLMVGMLIQLDKIDHKSVQSPADSQIVEVSGVLFKDGIDTSGWELIPDDESKFNGNFLISKFPASLDAAFTKMKNFCPQPTFKTRMRIRVLGERPLSPRYTAEVVEMIEVSFVCGANPPCVGHSH
jgi:hypothetical protein